MASATIDFAIFSVSVVCLYVCLSICLSVCLSVCVGYLPVCLVVKKRDLAHENWYEENFSLMKIDTRRHLATRKFDQKRKYETRCHGDRFFLMLDLLGKTSDWDARETPTIWTIIIFPTETKNWNSVCSFKIYLQFCSHICCKLWRERSRSNFVPQAICWNVNDIIKFKHKIYTHVH